MTGRSRPVIWSRSARADLANVWTYYARVAGQHVTEKLLLEIFDACRKLENHPYAGRPRDDIRLGLRSVLAKPLVIFYRVATDGSAEILRVFDGRRDVEGIFRRRPTTTSGAKD